MPLSKEVTRIENLIVHYKLEISNKKIRISPDAWKTRTLPICLIDKVPATVSYIAKITVITKVSKHEYHGD